MPRGSSEKSPSRPSSPDRSHRALFFPIVLPGSVVINIINVLLIKVGQSQCPFSSKMSVGLYWRQINNIVKYFFLEVPLFGMFVFLMRVHASSFVSQMNEKKHPVEICHKPYKIQHERGY